MRLAQSTDYDVRTEARSHIRALLTDALGALTAIDSGDFNSADLDLKRAMLAAADARGAIQVALVPTPAPTADALLKDWT